MEKPSPVEKKYEPVPQVTPSLPPATLPKPAPEGNIYCFNYIAVRIYTKLNCKKMHLCSVSHFCTLSIERDYLLCMPMSIMSYKYIQTCTQKLSDPYCEALLLTFLAFLQPSLLPEKTLSRATSCLTRVFLRSLQLMALVSSLQKQSLAPELHQCPAITAMHPSPTPRLPSLLPACSTVPNSTTTFCPMTNLKLLQR